MKSIKYVTLGLLLAFIAYSAPDTWVAIKRRMYEPPDRDSWQHPEKVIAALGLQPGQVVADLGAGGGYFTFRLAREVGVQGRVFAVDVDQGMLGYVEKQAAALGLPQIQTVLAPEDGLGLPENSLDLIFLTNTFHHLPEPPTYFAGARPLLRAGGRVAVVEFAESSTPPGHFTPPEDIRSAFERAGYRLAESHDFLESQSFQVFEVAAGDRGASGR